MKMMSIKGFKQKFFKKENNNHEPVHHKNVIY